MKKKNVDRNKIADRLKQARIKAGYKKAKDFAKKFKLSLPTYYHHENGTRNISLNILKQYANWLNIHPGWLMTGEEPYENITIIDTLSDEEFAKLSGKPLSHQDNTIDSNRLSNIIIEIYDAIQENSSIANHIKYAVRTGIDIYFSAIKITSNTSLQDQIIKSSIHGLCLGLKSKSKKVI